MLKLSKCHIVGLILSSFVLFPYLSDAQYFVAGQEPASTRWRQILTENFQIIYASDYEDQAQKVAHVFERVYGYSGQSLNHHPRKISVILHNSTVKSNGFVAWSPSRVELYTTPYQEMYGQDWIEQLAIHELRHHVQIDKIEYELPSIFRILLGEQAAALVVGAYLPFWFLEGDAVVAETAFSNSGRGRLPSFSMELKALVDEKGIYSFDKAYLGSYKNYIPDYYQLGYQMVSNIRNQNRGEVWGEVLHHIARHPLGLNSLSRGLKLSTGKNQDEYYRSIMSNLKTTSPFGFNKQEDAFLNRQFVHKSGEFYSSYSYPHLAEDSSFIALKTSLDKTPRIVLVDKYLNEKKIFEPGNVLEESLDYSDGKIAWMEAQPDLRWANKERSLLRILDRKDQTFQEKVFDEKLQAPVISPDGKSVAAVKFNYLNICSILLISMDSCKIYREFRAAGNQVFLTPSWSSDGGSIYAVELGKGGKSFVNIRVTDGAMTRLTEPVAYEIRKPIQRNHYLYYVSNYAGKDEGYALDLETNKRFRIVAAKYGIKDLQISEDGNSLIFGDYTSDGFKIARKTNFVSTWTDYTATDRFRDTLSAKLTDQEQGVIDFSSLDSTKFPSKKYVKIKNLINIHSWAPLYIDSDQSAVNLGFSVSSQNKLTTAITQFGYDYSTVNQTGKWVGKFEYTGWYPVISFYGDYGNESDTYYRVTHNAGSNTSPAKTDTVSVTYFQKVMNLKLDASIPFNFSRGKMFRLVKPEIQMGYSHYWEDKTIPAEIFSGNYIPLTYRIYAYNIRQQSHRDLQPRWGQVAELNYRCTPFGDKELGKIVSAEGTFYLPGILTNQGIKLYGGFQQKVSRDHFFNDLIYYPRGYANIENNRMFTLRSDYAMPLLSPDWHIWHLYYLKRVTVRLHYDFARVSALIHPANNTTEKTMSSTGAELMTECHFLRFIAPVKIGLRESYLIEKNSFTSEFIISVNFRGI